MRTSSLIIVGFTTGILFRSFVDLGITFSLLILLFGITVLIVWIVRRRPILLFAFCFLLGTALGALRCDYSDYSASHGLDSYTGNKVAVSGTLLEESIEKNSRQQFVFDVDGVVVNRATTTTKARVLVSAGLYPKHEYGEKLLLYGKLEQPENFSPDFRPVVDRSKRFTMGFSWKQYLAKDDIFYQMYEPKTTLIGTGGGSAIVRSLFGLKRAFLKNLNAVVPDPEAALGAGLVVGEKAAMSKELKDDFRRAGVSHIVVLSGYNLTVIGQSIESIAVLLLPRMAALSLGALGILLFALMAGGGASVFRAVVMAMIALLARSTGRLYEAKWALALAGVMMLLYNPRLLVFDLSFQLSFLATLGILYIEPVLRSRLGRIPEWKHFPFRSLASTTFAAQIAVFPLILSTMGNLSLVAPIVNLIVLPTVPLSMFLVFLTGTMGFLWGILSVVIGWASYVLLAFQILVVRFFASIPYASLQNLKFPWWLAVILYALIILFVIKYKDVPSEDKKKMVNVDSVKDYVIESVM